MYLDSAVLVKLFVREPDSEFFGKLTDGESISSSVLAYTEVGSAFLAKERAAAITPEQRRRAPTPLRERRLTTADLKRANRILGQCHPQVPLRSLDALHLASCDQLQDWPLCTTDKRMRDAAVTLHFPLTPMAS